MRTRASPPTPPLTKYGICCHTSLFRLTPTHPTAMRIAPDRRKTAAPTWCQLSRRPATLTVRFVVMLILRSGGGGGRGRTRPPPGGRGRWGERGGGPGATGDGPAPPHGA